MKVSTALRGISSIFLDTAPVIYFIQGDQRYLKVVQAVFSKIDQGTLRAVTSPVTLAECMVIPYRTNQLGLQQEFFNRITSGDSTDFIAINEQIADSAAKIRAQYNIELLDALQFGVALTQTAMHF